MFSINEDSKASDYDSHTTPTKKLGLKRKLKQRRSTNDSLVPVPRTPDKQSNNIKKVLIAHSNKVKKTIYNPFTGNTLDRVVDGESLAYSIRGIESFNSRVLFELSHNKLKDIIFDHFNASTDDCYLVRVNEDGKSSPYFLPDFADFAMLPLSLKLVVKHMVMSSNNIPPEVKGLWESCGPSLPNIRPCCSMKQGFEYWKCYSNASKLQIFSITQPKYKTICFRVGCENVSSNIVDGRKYSCHVVVTCNDPVLQYHYLYNDATILIWNCQGVGRPSFLPNLTELMKEHKPDIVVLLETRSGKGEVENKLLHYKIHKYTTMATYDYYGGVVIMSIRDEIAFKMIDNTAEDLFGYIEGIPLH